jgi:hypothetical protein
MILYVHVQYLQTRRQYVQVTTQLTNSLEQNHTWEATSILRDNHPLQADRWLFNTLAATLCIGKPSCASAI